MKKDIGDYMVLNIFNNIVEFMTELMNNFKGFVIENSTNPIFYIGLFFLGIFIFAATYRALNK